MKDSLKIKKYTGIYDKVNDLYCNKFFSIDKSCRSIGITSRTYCNICKFLNKKSIAYDDKRINLQKGGYGNAVPIELTPMKIDNNKENKPELPKISSSNINIPEPINIGGNTPEISKLVSERKKTRTRDITNLIDNKKKNLNNIL